MTAITKTIDNLIESARFVGATQAKRGYGVFTREDAIFERTCWESIERHAANLRSALAAPATTPTQPPGEPEWWRELLRQSYDNCLRNFGASTMGSWVYADLEERFSAAPQAQPAPEPERPAPATAPDELERKPSAKEVAWDRVRRSLVVRNAQITIGEVADTMDCQLNDAMKGTP